MPGKPSRTTRAWQPRQVYGFTSTGTSPLQRPCPKCDAPIGHRCRKWTRRDHAATGATWTPMTKVHDERRTKRTPPPEGDAA